MIYNLRSRKVTFRPPSKSAAAKRLSLKGRKSVRFIDGFEVTSSNKRSGKPRAKPKLKMPLSMPSSPSPGASGSGTSIAGGPIGRIISSTSIPQTRITPSPPKTLEDKIEIASGKLSKYASSIKSAMNGKPYTGEGSYLDFRAFYRTLTITVKGISPEVKVLITIVSTFGDEYYEVVNDLIYQLLWSCTGESSKARRLIEPFYDDSDGRRALLTLGLWANPTDLFSLEILEKSISTIVINGAEQDPTVPIQQMRCIAEQLVCAGQSFDDDRLIRRILGALGDDYATYVTSLTINTSKTFGNSEELKDELLTFYNLNRRRFGKSPILAAAEQKLADSEVRVAAAEAQYNMMLAALSTQQHSNSAPFGQQYDGNVGDAAAFGGKGSYKGGGKGGKGFKGGGKGKPARVQ